MHPLAALPDWLTAGVALGGAVAALVAAAFAVGVRLFPDPPAPSGDGSMAGEARRRAEIRDYLRAIDEPFSEDRRVAGRPVAFYLPRREVAITFDAREYFRLDRLGVRTVLVEHEMPGARIGRRLPFETPETGAAGDDGATHGDPTHPDSAFAALGLSPSATAEEVRAAYRERAKEAHPDNGGDAESFRELREAYTVARERTR